AKGGLHEDAYTITDEEAVCELDDDENIDNPAYIPKSGRYYMHDSRNADEERIHEPSRSRADGKWKHDRYDERSQRPKTRRELVSKYGFDIRDQNTEEGVRMSRTHTSAASTKHDSRGRGDHRPIRDDQRGEENRSIRTAHNNTSRLPAQHNSRGTAAGPPGQYAQHMSRVVRPSSHGSINTGDTARCLKQSSLLLFSRYVCHDDVGRIDGDKTYLRDEGGRNRTGGGRGNRAVQQHPARTQLGGGGGGGGGGGKRYSTQRLASNYADQGSLSLSAIANNWHSNFQQPQQAAMHVVQPRAVQHQPALPASRATHVPPPTAMHAAPNFPLPPSDIVYFDPQQQLVRKQIPPPPRAKKRLEIVPPTHSSVDNDDTIRK
ncbi:unnamed protein product, partial [Toxocara canis]|uniref:Protein CASC3 n=1 Tax=Toxocara canis TaxID=6265 RepID=A0A183UE90_TOXCA